MTSSRPHEDDPTPSDAPQTPQFNRYGITIPVDIRLKVDASKDLTDAFSGLLNPRTKQRLGKRAITLVSVEHTTLQQRTNARRTDGSGRLYIPEDERALSNYRQTIKPWEHGRQFRVARDSFNYEYDDGPQGARALFSLGLLLPSDDEPSELLPPVTGGSDIGQFAVAVAFYRRDMIGDDAQIDQAVMQIRSSLQADDGTVADDTAAPIGFYAHELRVLEPPQFLFHSVE